jgi:hypothetical protein
MPGNIHFVSKVLLLMDDSNSDKSHSESQSSRGKKNHQLLCLDGTQDWEDPEEKD